MKIDKATPGPWVVNFRADGSCYISMGDPIKGPHKQFDLLLEAGNFNDEDDARLIAAAPDLLVACQTFAEWLRREEAGGTNEPWAGRRDTPEGEAAWREWYDENLRICDLAQEQARAAIAKATGEAP